MFYKETNYGEDIDGNRGTTHINFDITEEDKDEILTQIYPLFMDGNLDEVVIPMYCFITEEFVDVVINISDYLEDLIKIGLEDVDYKDDSEIQEWLNNLERGLK